MNLIFVNRLPDKQIAEFLLLRPCRQDPLMIQWIPEWSSLIRLQKWRILKSIHIFGDPLFVLNLPNIRDEALRILVRSVIVNISLVEATPGPDLIFKQMNPERWPAPEGMGQWYLRRVSRGIRQYDTSSKALEPGRYWSNDSEIVWNDLNDSDDPGNVQMANKSHVNIQTDNSNDVVGITWR